jgi:hypothetical protein
VVVEEVAVGAEVLPPHAIPGMQHLSYMYSIGKILTFHYLFGIRFVYKFQGTKFYLKGFIMCVML